MSLLDDYFALREKVFEHFGYVEGWRALPPEDSRDVWWELDGEGPGEVRWSPVRDDLVSGNDENTYSAEVYTQRHLPRWVYRADDCTLIVVDTHTDGNQLLMVFDNAKELRPQP
jgi:hypothetical protein